MSYYDQTGLAKHIYTDTSQPLLPFIGRGRRGGMSGLGIDTSTIPVVATGVPPLPVPPDPPGTPVAAAYAPPGVALTVNDPQAMTALLVLQNQRYTPVNNRLCALQPAPSGQGSTLSDIVQAWSKAGLFVVINKADPGCPADLVGGGAGGGAVYGVGIDYIKNLAGTPGWSVLATPGGAPSTKANWDAWLAVGAKDPYAAPPPGTTPGQPPAPVQAGMSPAALLLGAVVVIGGVALLVESKKGSGAAMHANRRRSRRRRHR